MDKPNKTRSQIHHLDIVHPDQQRPEIHHALHKEVYQKDHLPKPKTLPYDPNMKNKWSMTMSNKNEYIKETILQAGIQKGPDNCSQIEICPTVWFFYLVG